MLGLKYFPKNWKNADVIMLPKPNKDDVSTELPAHQLLSSMRKIAERITLQRSEKLKRLWQNAVCVRLTKFATSNLNRNMTTSFLFLDSLAQKFRPQDEPAGVSVHRHHGGFISSRLTLAKREFSMTYHAAVTTKISYVYVKLEDHSDPVRLNDF